MPLIAKREQKKLGHRLLWRMDIIFRQMGMFLENKSRYFSAFDPFVTDGVAS
jgi:hypothetical protein